MFTVFVRGVFLCGADLCIDRAKVHDFAASSAFLSGCIQNQNAAQGSDFDSGCAWLYLGMYTIAFWAGRHDDLRVQN